MRRILSKYTGRYKIKTKTRSPKVRVPELNESTPSEFGHNASLPCWKPRPSCCSDGSSRAYFIVNRSRMPKTPLTHHLVALWFADIAEYSDRAAEDERSALQLIEILQSLSRDTVRSYEGRVVKFMGDAVLAEFPSTELAVRAAAALSEQYAKESAGTGRAHNLRVGVHIADVAVGADGDLYGDGVNAAARVQQAAEPGQVVLSQDVWRQLRGRTEFQFESLGDRSLKGVGLIGLYVVTLKEPAIRRQPSSAGSEIAQPAEDRKAGIRSIAVLPFTDLSPERDQEYFSDGVAEEILNALTKVAGLRVPARTSCFAFRGTSVDAREIGKRRGVERLLEAASAKPETDCASAYS